MKNSNTIRNWRSLGFCLALFAGLFICSCESDDDLPPDTTTTKVPYMCTSCATTSEALPENDNLAKGIYKGVFTKGTIVINFRNNDETAKAKVYYKNTIIDLMESPEIISVGDKPVRTLLRGSSGDTSVALYFSVNDQGAAPEVVNFIISSEPGRVDCTVFKEKSNMLIEAYEGNYFLVNGSAPVSNDPIEDSGDISGKVDPGTGVPANATSVGGVKMVLSRSGAMWMLFKVMGNNDRPVVDYGVINNSALVSDVSKKTVAYLSGDELNHSEYVTSGALRLYAERKR